MFAGSSVKLPGVFKAANPMAWKFVLAHLNMQGGSIIELCALILVWFKFLETLFTPDVQSLCTRCSDSLLWVETGLISAINQLSWWNWVINLAVSSFDSLRDKNGLAYLPTRPNKTPITLQWWSPPLIPAPSVNKCSRTQCFPAAASASNSNLF